MLLSLVAHKGPADDGKRWYSDGRFISKGEMILKKWRGGLGERGCQIAPGRTQADILFGVSLRFFLVVFSVLFSGCPGTLFWLSGASWGLPGSLRDVIFSRISRISRFWGRL